MSGAGGRAAARRAAARPVVAARRVDAPVVTPLSRGIILRSATESLLTTGMNPVVLQVLHPTPNTGGDKSNHARIVVSDGQNCAYAILDTSVRGRFCELQLGTIFSAGVVQPFPPHLFVKRMSNNGVCAGVRFHLLNWSVLH
jgi:hypothetical protein